MRVGAAASAAAYVPASSAAGGIAVACVAAAAAGEFAAAAVVATDASAAAASDAGDAAAAAAAASVAVAILVSQRNSCLKTHCCLGIPDGSQVPGVAWHVQTPIGRVAEWGPACRDACLEADIGGPQACGPVGGPGTEHGALLPSRDDPTPAREPVRYPCRTERMPGKAFLTLKPPSHDPPCEKL